MSTTTLLAALALIRYPAVIVGAIAVFGLSSQSALSLIAAHADRFTRPIAADRSFSVPAPVQLADLTPPRVVPTKPRNDGAGSMGTVPAAGAIEVALAVPADTDETTLPARIGDAAVNLRSGPSKSSNTLGVLDAGTPVRLGEERRGWVNVFADGRSGWVYERYLVRDATLSITVSGGVAMLDP